MNSYVGRYIIPMIFDTHNGINSNNFNLKQIHCSAIYESEHSSYILISCSYRALSDVVEMTNNMHRFAILLYIPAPTCFGSSLSSSGSFWIRLSYMKIQIDMVVYHVMLVKWPVCRSIVVPKECLFLTAAMVGQFATIPASLSVNATAFLTRR
jgi:hypothetical protein